MGKLPGDFKTKKGIYKVVLFLKQYICILMNYKCIMLPFYIILSCMLLTDYGMAQKNVYSEYHLKAAFLYNFAKFVQWPSGTFNSADTPIILCIYGLDSFKEALDTIENKLIRNRRLMIKKSPHSKEVKQCHILFVSSSESKNVSDLLSLTKNLPILTVSDIKGFSDHGGMIALIKKDNKIRFDVNLDAAEGSNLKINSHLLRLARDIIKRGYQ